MINYLTFRLKNLTQYVTFTRETVTYCDVTAVIRSPRATERLTTLETFFFAN